jgi:hypothetical protein
MGSPKIHNHMTGYTSRTRGIMRMLMQHLSIRLGKSSEQIYQDFTEDYGSISKRVVLRYLNNLIRMGCVRREDDEEFDFEIGHLRPMYYLVTTRLPSRDRVCPLCGMWRATTMSHPKHTSALDEHRTYLNRYYSGCASDQRPAFMPSSPPGRTIAEMSTSPQPGAVSG